MITLLLGCIDCVYEVLYDRRFAVPPPVDAYKVVAFF